MARLDEEREAIAPRRSMLSSNGLFGSPSVAWIVGIVLEERDSDPPFPFGCVEWKTTTNDRMSMCRGGSTLDPWKEAMWMHHEYL